MWILFLIIGLIVLFLLILLFVAIKCQRNYWYYKGIPHERPKKLWDIIKIVATQSLSSEETKMQHYNQLYIKFKGTGPFCGFYALLQPRALALDNELITQIIIKDFCNFNDRGLFSNRSGDPLSGTLYSLRGNTWKEMRQKLDVIFEKQNMAWIYSNIYVEANNLLKIIEKTLAQQVHRTLHIQNLMCRYVLSTLANCIFGLDAALREKYPIEQFEKMAQLALSTRRHGYFFNLFMIRFPNLSRKLRLRTTSYKAERYFLDLIQDVVQQREKTGIRHQDYLQLLMDIRAQEMNTHKNEGATNIKQHLDNELAAHAFVFLKAGFKNTADTLTYVLYELALNTNVQTRVRDELQNALNKNNENLDYECIISLKYMGQVISETLRLHPVTPYLLRRTLNDYKVPDYPKYQLSKELFIIIPIHALHNDPAYYPDPTLFNPERFTCNENRMRERCIWFGFGEGARNCIGLHFAQLLLRLGLAMLLLKYEFTLNNKRPLVNCKDGVALHVTPLGEVEHIGEERAV